MNDPFGEVFDIVPVILPLDLQTARSGDWVSLKNAQGAYVVIFKGAGTDGDDPTFTLRQATAVAGTSAKDAAIITEYFEKEGTLTSVGSWTRVTQSAAATIAPGDPSAQSEAIYVTRVETDLLDVDGGFDCITVNSADVGNNAQLGCVLFLLYGLRYGGRPDALPSAIAD